MKKVIIFTFIFLISTQNFANPIFKSYNLFLENKGNFSGKVIDSKTGLGIEGVSIYFNDIKIGTSTNNKGEFDIHNISEGNHLIEISHIGYTTIAENVLITTDTKKIFSLSQSIVENNTVVVTGVSGATQTKKIPFNISVLKKDDFFKNTSTNIIESLTKIGGVSTMATGPAISKPIIRGLGYNRVLTINDGVRQEGQQWGDEHGIEIDEASVSKIELLKGPASIIYGSDALAGVINIITNVPVANNTVVANVSSNYQSNNKLRTINANIGANKNGLSFNLYSSNKWASDYKNKYDGSVFNSKFNEHNIGGYVGYNAGWGYSHILFSKFNLTTGLVEGQRDSLGYFVKQITSNIVERATASDFNSTNPLIPYQNIQHFKLATDNSIKINNARLAFNIGFQQNKRAEFGNADNQNEKSLYFDLKTITYTAQYYFPIKNGFKNSFGLNGMQQQNINLGEEQLIPNYHLFDIGCFIFSQKTIKNLTISGGIRFDNRSLTTQNLMDSIFVKSFGFSKSFSNYSGSIGAAYQATDQLNFKLNIAKGFRAPSTSELASNGNHEGTLRYEYGNKNLQSENSIQFDGGIDFTSNHISIGASIFYNYFTNFIFYQKLQSFAGGDSIVQLGSTNLTAFKYNQHETSLAGIELKFDIHPHPIDWLHIENTFSYVRGKFSNAIDGSSNLPFMPAPKLLTELRSDFKNLGKIISNLYIKLDVENTFAQNKIFSAFNTETATNGYTLLNAGFGGNILSKNKKTICSLSFSAINLTDKAYQNHLSRLKYADINLVTQRYGVYNMGRNFSIKLNIPLNFKLN